jgi:hypothetical protein
MTVISIAGLCAICITIGFLLAASGALLLINDSLRCRNDQLEARLNACTSNLHRAHLDLQQQKTKVS